MNALVRIHTGPSMVQQAAQQVRDAGFTVQTEGTEHIFVIMPLDNSGWGILPSCRKLDESVGYYLSKGACVMKRLSEEENEAHVLSEPSPS